GGARKLGIQQRHQLTLRCQPAYTAIGTVRLHQPFELAPRQVLQNFMKDAIVMPHGAEPLLLSRNVCRRPRPSRINAMHPVHENSNRTAVSTMATSWSETTNSARASRTGFCCFTIGDLPPRQRLHQNDMMVPLEFR